MDLSSLETDKILNSSARLLAPTNKDDSSSEGVNKEQNYFSVYRVGAGDTGEELILPDFTLRNLTRIGCQRLEGLPFSSWNLELVSLQICTMQSSRFHLQAWTVRASSHTVCEIQSRDGGRRFHHETYSVYKLELRHVVTWRQAEPLGKHNVRPAAPHQSSCSEAKTRWEETFSFVTHSTEEQKKILPPTRVCQKCPASWNRRWSWRIKLYSDEKWQLNLPGFLFQKARLQ